MLLSVQEAQDIILGHVAPLNRRTTRPLKEALGSLLAEDMYAEGDIPPFTNSSMDGYAIRSQDVNGSNPNHPTTLAIIGTIRAGHPATTPLQPGQCYKIMTGAPVPPTADAVIPVESTRTSGDPTVVEILLPAKKGDYLRMKGEDMREGQVVLHQGTPISPPIVGMLATLGAHQVPIMESPRIAILSTGDELKEPDQPLTPGAIRNSNSYALYAAIAQAGGRPTLYPSAPDDPQIIRTLFERAARESDLLVSSGGVSVGDFDFVKPVIESLGELTLWRVNLKPGKPLAFGYVMGVPIIGLPGNPVSALVTFELFVRPAIRTLMGDTHWQRPVVQLPLATNFTDVVDRRQYVRARLILRDGSLQLSPHTNQGSAVQSSWQNVDALMVIPENTGPYQPGDLVEALLLSLEHVR